jgi:metallo-beta-lactamase family protein
VLFVGYQADGTRGRSLLEGVRQLKIHGQMVDVRAEIKMLGQFSAHADYSEILRWLRNFKRAPREVFIVHGEPEPRRALREKIVREFGWKVTLPEHLQKFDLK